MRLARVAGSLLVGVVAATGLAVAQNYPNKPLRIVTAEAGSGGDLMSRFVAQGLSEAVGQPVIVENRGGAAGVIAAMTVVKAPPDGYTMLLYGNSMWILPLLRNNVPYNPEKDFSPVILAASSPLILVVHPSVAAGSTKELIALLKAKPGALSYGSAGPGSTPHLAAELFKAMAGVNAVHVPYKGSGSALNGLIANQVQLMFPNAGTGVPHVKSGRVKALAVTSAQPSALVPGLPTLAESGVPGYESTQVHGIYTPAKTPAAIIGRLNQEIAKVLNKADVKEKIFNTGTEVVASSPQQLLASAKGDVARLGKVIKDAGIRDD